MRTLLHTLFLIASIQNASALDLGFYPDNESTRPGCQELLDLESRADRVIGCGKDLKLDIGVGPLVDTGLDGEFRKARRPILFEFAEVESFLKNERHKDLLVFRFDKSIMWNEREEIESYVTRIIDLAKRLKYKRVMVLGSHAFGMHYLAGITSPEASPPNKEKP